MDEQRLFTLAADVINLHAVHDAGEGWRLTVGVRRNQQSWEAAHRETYSHLTTAELVDVIMIELSNATGDL
jgi:ketol-acid reductoisomerase